MLLLTNLTVGYANNILLEDVNLTLQSGETAYIKTSVLDGGSSLLKSCAGVTTPLDGEVRIDGKRISSLGARNRFNAVTLCYEMGGLISVFTNFNNIALPIFYHNNLSSAEVSARIADIADKLSITDLLHRESFQLNDVQIRLVNLARALVIRPKVILLDELQAGMSSSMRERILDVVLKEQLLHNYAIIMISTAGDDIQHAHQIYKIDQKKLVREPF